MENKRKNLFQYKLTVVTGSFFIWGFMLLKLYPKIVRFCVDYSEIDNTKFSFFEYVFLRNSGVVNLNLRFFEGLELIVTAGLSIIVISILYVFSLSAWLATFSTTDDETIDNKLNINLKKISDYFYELLLLVLYMSILIAIFILFWFFGSMITNYLVKTFGTNLKIQFILLIFQIICAMLLFTFSISIYALIRGDEKTLLQAIGKTPSIIARLFNEKLKQIIGALLIIFLINYVSILLSFSMEIEIDKKRLNKKKNEQTEIIIKFGGRIDPMIADLVVKTAEGKEILKLDISRYSKCKFVSQLNSSKLKVGKYVIALSHPRPSLQFSFPFFHNGTHTSQEIIIE